MSHKSALDSMIDIQSFDPATNIFASHNSKTKKIDLAAVWIGTPLGAFGESQLLAVQSVLSSPYPVNTTLQFGLLATPDIDDSIVWYKDRKLACENPLLNELIERQADLIAGGTEVPIVPSSGVHLCKKRIVITMRTPYNVGNPGNLVFFNEAASKFESSFNATGFDIKRANINEYLGLMRLITHIFDKVDDRYDESFGVNEQLFFKGDEIIIQKDHIAFETGESKQTNFFAAALSPKHLPREFSLALMNYMIGDPRGVNNQIRHPYYMNLTLRYPDQVTKKSSIEQKANWINHQLFGGTGAKFMPNLVLKKEGFDVLQNELETRSAVLVETTFTFWLFSRKLEEVKSHIEDIRTYWTSLGFEMRMDKNVLDVLLGQTLPLGATYERSAGLFRTHTLTSSQASQFLPIFGEWRGTTDSCILLTTRRGEVAGFDLFNSSMNFNAVLVAAPGAGKSFVTQRIITDYLAEGAKIWVIDSGRSYQKLAAASGGTFMEFSPDSDVCLNPFTGFLAERGGLNRKIDDEMDMLASLIERMAAQRDPLDDIGVEIIKRAIRQTFIEHQGYTTVRNIADWLTAQVNDDRAKDLAMRMDSFAYGQYAKFFNGHANVNMQNDFVVLELDDLKNQRQLQQVVLLQLVAQITNEMYFDSKRKKLLIIDEGWELLDDPVMAKAMESAYRKARKFNGGIITVTQGIADLYKSSSGQSMIDNASWQIILQQKAEAIDAVRKAGQLSLDEYNFEMLKTITTVPGSHSELMIVGNGAAGIFRLAVDKFTQAMFSTTGKARYQVLEDIENGMDVIESIERQVVGAETMDIIKNIRELSKLAEQIGLNKLEVRRLVIDALT